VLAVSSPRGRLEFRRLRLVCISAGSTIVYPYNDTSLRPIELGASVFVEANKNLWRATEEFNITRYGFTNGDDDSKTGIWDGHEFRIIASNLLLP
jgi:prenylcysteine oxidase / farnesylcysteine lyase